MDGFQGKNVWIIGASSGIGYALAKELSKRGANLILSARSTDKLEYLNNEMEGHHHICPLDVSDIRSVQQAFHYIQKQLGHIDSAINLAALYDPGRLDNMDIEKTRQLVNVNLMGCFNIVYTILPTFIMQEHGQFVLCGSVAGFRGLPKGQPYSATKAAVINLAESLKAENPNFDIKLINPGFVRTPLTDKNDFDMPMMIEPEQAAKAIAEGLLKSRFEIHFPKKFTIWMKVLRILPNSLYLKIARKLINNMSS
jgi:short-subunit dehydrogenase